MEFPKELNDEIENYCKANNISNVDEFKLKLIKQAFTIEKYGRGPIIKPKPVESEIKPINIEITKDMVEINEIHEKMSKLGISITDMSDVLRKIESEKNNKKDIYGEK